MDPFPKIKISTENFQKPQNRLFNKKKMFAGGGLKTKTKSNAPSKNGIFEEKSYFGVRA